MEFGVEEKKENVFLALLIAPAYSHTFLKDVSKTPFHFKNALSSSKFIIPKKRYFFFVRL